MAWEISITAEGWSEIRKKLDDWKRQDLVAAITDDKFEAVYEKAGMEHAKRAAEAERKRIKDLPHDVLADRAFELIEQNNTKYAWVKITSHRGAAPTTWPAMQNNDRYSVRTSTLLDIDFMTVANLQHTLIERLNRRIKVRQCAFLAQYPVHIIPI